MGEAKHKALVRQNGTIALDTFGGRIHVEWDPAAAVTPMSALRVSSPMAWSCASVISPLGNTISTECSWFW